jgi:hypothetical protein
MDQTPTWAKYWRRKAEKARAAAAEMSDNELKQQMFALASTYEQLARRAVERNPQKLQVEREPTDQSAE